ncbi:glycoside hydrolase superfamily [Phaeosphaeria sp. MPI-PUGE-AT-0046c]|nr:glycoside hydrolase superfamily [Phaeosphaeria sp. MPI-PUGE-AT-0046c]
MRFSASVVAAAGLFTSTNAAIKGFNYGSTFNNNQAKVVADYEYEFNAAKNLPGTSGWTSARLYTMIQAGTTNNVIDAIQAAINTQTGLLLGMWASAGQDNFNNELTALKAAIAQYGSAFADLVEGISVGSEDLYRITPTGIENKSGAGAQPQELINYVQQTRDAISGTVLQGKPVGHVDTWTAYVNATNNDFISTLDFLGMDAYPYFQTTMANGIGSGSQLFFDAFYATQGASQGKPVWVTETGWPVSGETLNQAAPGADNARIYWEDVTCQLVRDNINLYYYTLQDVQLGNPSPSFGVKPAGDLQSVSPLFDLSCPASSSILEYILPAIWRCDCPCLNTFRLPVHTSAWTTRSTGWIARANGQAKSSSMQLSSKASPSSSIVRSSTRSAVITTRLSTLPTSQPTTLTISAISAVLPSSKRTVPAPSMSSVHLIDLPIPTDGPACLPGGSESPHLIVPVDKANSSKMVGNGFTAELSSTISTVFVFDVRPEHRGKICSLVFYVPPMASSAAIAPFSIKAPGGISVSRLAGDIATPKISANSVGSSTPVGRVSSVQPASQYTISSAPCDAGQRVGYQVDALGGLAMDFFQMISPPLGLFVIPV